MSLAQKTIYNSTTQYMSALVAVLSGRRSLAQPANHSRFKELNTFFPLQKETCTVPFSAEHHHSVVLQLTTKVSLFKRLPDTHCKTVRLKYIKSFHFLQLRAIYQSGEVVIGRGSKKLTTPPSKKKLFVNLCVLS